MRLQSLRFIPGKKRRTKTEIYLPPTDANPSRREPRAPAMCRFCEAIGPICRYITDPNWSEGTPHHVPHRPPPPDDLLADPEQTTSVQQAGLNGPQRPRTARPKAAARRKPFVKTGASRPKPAVFPDRLHWPALALHWPLELTVGCAPCARCTKCQSSCRPLVHDFSRLTE